MRMIEIECPGAPSSRLEETVELEVPVMEARAEIIHGTAVHFQWKNGSWLNFDEFGQVFSWSTGIGEKQISQAAAMLPDMDALRMTRVAFRTLFLEEAERALSDKRISKPTKAHGGNHFGKNTQKAMANELKNLGYQTADRWSPWSRFKGCDQYDHLLFPSPQNLSDARRMNEKVNMSRGGQ